MKKQDCIQLLLEQAECPIVMRRLFEFQATGLIQSEECNEDKSHKPQHDVVDD
jgi:hypothetical protein